MEEYDAHEIDTTVRLGAYEKDHRQQTPELGPNTSKRPSLAKTTQSEATDTKPEETHTEAT